MKTFFTIAVIAVVVLILTSSHSFAQSGTLVVYANGPTIDQVINGDVTGGVQNHSVYQLVSLDTTYLLDATITSQSSISIIGVPHPTTGKLPCIQADVLTGGSIPGIFFTFTGQGTRVALKNLYLLGIAPNNSNNTAFGQGVQISADSISLTVDNCVFDFMSQFEIAFGSNWNKFYITNSKFRNGIDVATAYYVPELLRSLNGLGNWSTDTIVIKYNTLLGLAMGPVITTGITRYFELSHNDIILAAKAPFWSEQVVNAKFNNNIFYDVYATGESKTEYNGGWDEIFPPRIPALFSFGPLDSTKAALFLGHPRNGASDSLAAEAMRTVEVKDNLYYWSSGLTDFWTTWNSTHTGITDSIITPVFMNDETAAMFSNKTVWPGFTESNNQNIDPGFGATLETALSPGADTAYGVGLLDWIAAVRGGTGTTEYYSYQKTVVEQVLDWTPEWPLPEYTSGDLRYTESLTAPDGYPYGDPFWFDITVGVKTLPNQLPNAFVLYEAYPNPFNPSTTIKFALPKESAVELAVFNLLGEKVLDLINQEMPAGYHQTVFDAGSLSSGIYFYRIQAGTFIETKKLLLLK